MQKTILRLIWPYVQRYLAKYAADYLEKRRQLKRQLKEEEARLAELAQDLQSAIPAKPAEYSSSPKLLTTNAVWYILAGILIGSALSWMLVNILRKED